MPKRGGIHLIQIFEFEDNARNVLISILEGNKQTYSGDIIVTNNSYNSHKKIKEQGYILVSEIKPKKHEHGRFIVYDSGYSVWSMNKI